jgi:hypothetical protein
VVRRIARVNTRVAEAKRRQTGWARQVGLRIEGQAGRQRAGRWTAERRRLPGGIAMASAERLPQGADGTLCMGATPLAGWLAGSGTWAEPLMGV